MVIADKHPKISRLCFLERARRFCRHPGTLEELDLQAAHWCSHCGEVVPDQIAREKGLLGPEEAPGSPWFSEEQRKLKEAVRFYRQGLWEGRLLKFGDGTTFGYKVVYDRDAAGATIRIEKVGSRG